MAVLIKDFDKPVACEWVDDKNHLHRCLFLNGDDDCILHHCPEGWSWNEQYDACPLVEGKENVKGRWRRRIVDSGFNSDWVCSECGDRWKYDFINFNFCPNCGADMRGEEDETDRCRAVGR